jgi:predicted P-loop ATPase
MTSINGSSNIPAQHVKLIKEYIDTIPWDGIDRIAAVCNTVISGYPLKNICITNYLIGAVAVIYRETADILPPAVLIMETDELAKHNQWAHRIFSVVPGAYTISDDSNLDSSQLSGKISSSWCINLSNLKRLYRSDPIEFNHFAVRDMDAHTLRTAVLTAACENIDFLPDHISKYWTIPVVAIDVDTLNTLDVQQIWAQAKSNYRAGYPWWLMSSDTKLLSHYITPKSIEELYCAAYLKDGDIYYSVNEIMMLLTQLGAKITSKSKTRIDRACDHLNFQKRVLCGKNYYAVELKGPRKESYEYNDLPILSK